jgi:hypothetical protein
LALPKDSRSDHDRFRWLEHAVEMFRRLGGGVFGDVASELPASQLAILPGTTHVGMLERADWIASMVSRFLDTPRHPPGL